MSPFRILLYISCSVLCGISCTATKPIEPKKEPQQDVLVGRVAAVYTDAKYMLVQKYRTFSSSSDTIFYSRSEDGTISPVKMTEQKLGQFYVADLTDGSHTINDPVFMRNLRKISQVDAIKSDTKPSSLAQ